MEAYVFTIYIFPRGCRPHMAQVSCKFTPWKGRWESVRIWVGSMNLQETWANSRCTFSSLRHAWWWLWLLCRWCQPPAPLIIKVKFRSIVLLLLQFCVRVWMLDLGSMGRYDHSHSATLHRPNMICQIFFNISFEILPGSDSHFAIMPVIKPDAQRVKLLKVGWWGPS